MIWEYRTSTVCEIIFVQWYGFSTVFLSMGGGEIARSDGNSGQKVYMCSTCLCL
jgi:hypothetical protein